MGLAVGVGITLLPLCSILIIPVYQIQCAPAELVDAKRLKSAYIKIVNGGVQVLGSQCANFTFTIPGETNITHEMDEEVASYAGESAASIVDQFNSLDESTLKDKDPKTLLSYTASLYEETYMDIAKPMCSMKKGLICDHETFRCAKCRSPEACGNVWKIAHAKDIDPTAPLNIQDAKEYLRILREVGFKGQTVGQPCDVAASAEALISSDLSEEDTLLNLRALGLDREKITIIGENLQLSKTICASKLNLACVPLYNWWDTEKAEAGVAGVVGKCKWCSEIKKDQQIYVHKRFQKLCGDFVTVRRGNKGQRLVSDGVRSSSSRIRSAFMKNNDPTGYCSLLLLLYTTYYLL